MDVDASAIPGQKPQQPVVGPVGMAPILLHASFALLIVLGVVALPVVGYLMLDPSQRRRLRAQGRKRLGGG